MPVIGVNPPLDPNDESLELEELVLFFFRHGRRIARWTFIGILAGLGISSLIQPKWQAEAQLLLPKTRRTLGQLSGQAAGLALNLDLGDISQGFTEKTFERALKSRALKTALAERMHLVQAYGTRSFEATLGRLEQSLSAETRDNLLRLTYTDTDPARAAEVCNAAADELRGLLQRLQSSQARDRRVFLEGRVKSVRSELSQAEETLRARQSELRAIDPVEQGRVSLAISRDLLTEYCRESVGLSVLGMDRQAAAPEALASQARVRELAAQLQRIERGTSAENMPATSLPSSAALPLEAVPRVRLVLGRMERQVAVLNAVFLLLTQEYERARIDEADDVQRLAVLDRAVIPARRSSPVPILWMLGCGAAGFCLAIVRLWLAAWISALRKTASESSTELLSSLGRVARWLEL